jgi:hypothetical protein
MLLLCYNATYWTPPETDRRKTNKHVPFSPGEPKPFKLPYNRVRAAGIASHETIMRGFMELVALGFISFVRGCKGGANVYIVSDDYEKLSEQDVKRIKRELKPLRKP